MTAFLSISYFGKHRSPYNCRETPHHNVSLRHEYEDVGDEDREAAEADDVWGYGELEGVEEGRRGV